MTLSSRERMLAALSCALVDYPPCCFMQFSGLEAKCNSQLQMAEQYLAWGMDAMIQVPPWLLTAGGDTADLRGLPVHFHPGVRVREWQEPAAEGERYRTLNKEYATPAGSLTTRINQTDDWPYGDHVPFLDDFNVPRAQKHLVTGAQDLAALRYLLPPPDKAIIAEFRENSRPAQQFARKHDLLVSGGAGVGADMAGWLFGLQELIVASVRQPDLVSELMQIIADWNIGRMQVVLDAGIDLWVRRGWYESCDFWSPKLYRKFILPHIEREAELAHGHGVKFGYILTSRVMPLLDMIVEAGVDVLIGVDPVMGGTNLKQLKEKANGCLCLWGGVNGPITVERGSPEEVRRATQEALALLAPGNGFILSPVDEVDDPSEHAWHNVEVLIETWKEHRRQ